MSSPKRLTISGVTFLAERLATTPDIRWLSNSDVSQSGTWVNLSKETAHFAENFCWLVKDFDVKSGEVKATANSSIISLNHLYSLTRRFFCIPNFSQPKIKAEAGTAITSHFCFLHKKTKPSITAITDFRYFKEHLNSALREILWSEILVSNSCRHCEAMSLTEDGPWHGINHGTECGQK
jgi:hypothetical protein